jgi:hypothetical protein
LNVFVCRLINYAFSSRYRATNDGSRICQHWQRSANCTGHFRCEYNYSNLFIYLLNMYYLYLCISTSAKCMSVELKVYLFIWSHNFRFSNRKCPVQFADLCQCWQILEPSFVARYTKVIINTWQQQFIFICGVIGRSHLIVKLSAICCYVNFGFSFA